MSPVHIDELNPDTRTRVLKQIGETGGDTSALATIEEKSSLTLSDPNKMTNDELADMVIGGVKKIRVYLPYIRTLKERFDSGTRDSTNRLKTPIKGCCSWTEFCDEHLDRTPRAIREALREPKSQPQPKQAPERTLEDVLDKLVERIVLQPYGYYASKFKIYPQQHTSELKIVDLAKEEVWKQIVEIGQAKLALRTSLENIG